MRCIFCGCLESKVIDSRATEEGNSIRRRRECTACLKRFTTYEMVEQVPLMVIKKNGQRVLFERHKILNGILRACEKRPISVQQMELVTDAVEKEIRNRLEREISSTQIGELVMRQLKELDQVAYVRFASVYRQFADIHSFMQEVEMLMKGKQAEK